MVKQLKTNRRLSGIHYTVKSIEIGYETIPPHPDNRYCQHVINNTLGTDPWLGGRLLKDLN